MIRLVGIGLSVCLLLSAAIVMASHPGHDEPHGKVVVPTEVPTVAGDVTSVPAGEFRAISLSGGPPSVRLLSA